MRKQKWMTLLMWPLLLCNCVGHKVIDVLMSEKELLFYQSLDQNPLKVDSVKREIHRMTFGDHELVADVEIYVNTDRLRKADADVIAVKVAKFNSEFTLSEGLKFDRCLIDIENSTYV